MTVTCNKCGITNEYDLYFHKCETKAVDFTAMFDVVEVDIKTKLTPEAQEEIMDWTSDLDELL